MSKEKDDKVVKPTPEPSLNDQQQTHHTGLISMLSRSDDRTLQSVRSVCILSEQKRVQSQDIKEFSASPGSYHTPSGNLRSAHFSAKLASHFSEEDSPTFGRTRLVSWEMLDTFYDCTEYTEIKQASLLHSQDQIKLNKMEVELAGCKRHLEAANSEAALAQTEPATLKGFFLNLTKEFKINRDCMTVDTALSPAEANADDQDNSHNALCQVDQEVAGNSTGIAADILDAINDMEVASKGIRTLMEILGTENAYLKRTLETCQSTIADRLVQINTKDTEISGLQKELTKQKDLTSNAKTNASNLEQELTLLKEDCVAKEPLIQVGAAVRLAFLERSKPKPHDSLMLNHDIFSASTAAAQDGNVLADLALLRVGGCDAAKFQVAFSDLYRCNFRAITAAGPVLLQAFKLHATARILNGGNGMPNLRLSFDAAFITICNSARQRTLEGTPEGQRLLRRAESSLNETVVCTRKNETRRAGLLR
ncbi:uncharacterized protein RCO7_08809 [Rhynchosporium graminicola]|uniref:Uncharacterized protein n=1 Tax=Rhynchosporium graminicola TaxID=2792576 RepID=A0A1E1KCW4_9HELO|nr:uncharacterized protein RCO7_08809 [Rhynchosporium commune]